MNKVRFTRTDITGAAVTLEECQEATFEMKGPPSGVYGQGMCAKC